MAAGEARGSTDRIAHAPVARMGVGAVLGSIVAAGAYAVGAADVVPAPIGLLAAATLGALLPPLARPAELTADGDHLDGWRLIQVELDRGRRYERPVAIVRFFADLPSGGSAAERHQRIAAALRSSDRSWIDGDDVIVLLPETDAAGAELWRARLERWAGGESLASIQSVFPEDGVTSGALISALYGRRVQGHRVAMASRNRPSLVDEPAAQVTEDRRAS